MAKTSWARQLKTATIRARWMVMQAHSLLFQHAMDFGMNYFDYWLRSHLRFFQAFPVKNCFAIRYPIISFVNGYKIKSWLDRYQFFLAYLVQNPAARSADFGNNRNRNPLINHKELKIYRFKNLKYAVAKTNWSGNENVGKIGEYGRNSKYDKSPINRFLSPWWVWICKNFLAVARLTQDTTRQSSKIATII